ncbi:hypothetical protein GWK08_04105 [Leptobacterium flavescens]|uniref:Uncharacterized protein n=1 Tax=Leptobacterium flavescens TaxID=472055 RepID=A0A6P0UH27_9FLAO|nr:hypothetical protein [Leptobacterium flavescens]NER12611.1 hypothetical protein [Leptobacterium flavescens]
MKKVVLILTVILIFGFTTREETNNNPNTAIVNSTIAEEIDAFNSIINKKLETAEELENRASLLFKKDSNSKEGQSLLREAQLQRTMTLKYKAAIACRLNFNGGN